MRGKVKNYSFTESASGITPAYAGKSQKTHMWFFRHKDHPRLCGEKSNAMKLCEADLRITPAYAGKSST